MGPCEQNASCTTRLASLQRESGNGERQEASQRRGSQKRNTECQGIRAQQWSDVRSGWQRDSTNSGLGTAAQANIYVVWTNNSNTAECGWCQCKLQTRNHLFKECRQWKEKQKVLWAEVRRATGKGKNRFRIRDLLADERCTRPILGFLHTTAVGSRVGPRAKPQELGDEELEGETAEDEGEE